MAGWPAWGAGCATWGWGGGGVAAVVFVAAGRGGAWLMMLPHWLQNREFSGWEAPQKGQVAIRGNLRTGKSGCGSADMW
uniref:Uncharacterized protein n=1 Tax=termite gut metagenome TaxID=433724 RepID=S0DE38_9ZZZZ